MIKLVNPSGGETWVADNRVDEYLRAGFLLAFKEVKAPKKPAEKKTKK